MQETFSTFDLIKQMNIYGIEFWSAKAPLPEDLPSAPSIRKLVEERQRAVKKRKIKATEQENNGQDALF